MAFTEDQTKELSAKLDPSHIRPPKQWGPKGDYLEGWFVISEANRVFGFDGWSYEVIEARCVCENPRQIGQQKKDGWGVTYTARVRVVVKDVIREDFGAGHGYDVDAGLAHEGAVKEAVTDALKRALRTFGNSFGLALYDKSRANVGPSEETPSESTSKPVSSAQMKKGLEAIDQDLVDCHSVAAVLQCANGWKTIMDRDGWSKDFRELAGDKFRNRRDEIKSIQDASDVFPGDLPNDYIHNHPLNAG